MALRPVRRPDFNQSLVHLTRERVERLPDAGTRVVSAFDVLKEIISHGKIRASGNDGYVKGSQPVAYLKSRSHRFTT
jgi:hypothetical protein